MTRLQRCVAVVTLGVMLVAPAESAWSQSVPPPSAWHPYRGGTNCIQVADAQGNFNCAAGTRVDPATGNMIIGGSLSFSGFAAGAFANGLILAPVNSGAQVLNAGELVIATSPPTVATAGPLIRGVTLRVRQVSGGRCQLVVAGGNGLQEFIVPVSNPALPVGFPGSMLSSFPGGASGC